MSALFYRFKVPIFEWREQRWVRSHFYHDATFKALDQKLLSGPNPYHTASIFPYGETPLRVLCQIAQTVQLGPQDHFVDLGCGRGRAVFFLSHFFGCRATGIDLTPSFIRRAQKLSTHKTTFLCQDFTSYHFRGTTCVYLYGTTYADTLIQKLEARLPPNCSIITVSAPLSTRKIVHRFQASFNWGQAELFVHEPDLSYSRCKFS